MDALRCRLMLQESTSWAEAANTLDCAGAHLDAVYLLRLLAFEILLKTLAEKHGSTEAPKHHQYEKIFEPLPEMVRQRVIELAGELIGPSELNKNPTAVLEVLGKNFIALRYPWERYSGLTEAEYIRKGEEWLASGAPLEQATFIYYSEELRGLTHAARELAIS